MFNHHPSTTGRARQRLRQRQRRTLSDGRATNTAVPTQHFKTTSILQTHNANALDNINVIYHHK